MTESLSYSAAFLLGLLGSPHCVGMCGGIAGLLASSTATRQDHRKDYIPVAERGDGVALATQVQQLSLTLLFQIGRVTCYALLGAIAGGLIGSLVTASSFVIKDVAWLSLCLRIMASAMLIAVALSVAGWSSLSVTLEKAGAVLWRRVQPFTQHFLPIDNPLRALVVGGLWGLLPCGLIYSALAWSALSGNASQSALLMLCFGLGTTPAVLGISAAVIGGQVNLHRPSLRRAFALLLIGLALLPWALSGAHLISRDSATTAAPHHGH